MEIRRIFQIKNTPGGLKMNMKLGLIALIAILMTGLVSASDSQKPTCVFDLAATTAGTSSGYIRGLTQSLAITVTYPTNINFSLNTTVNVTMCNISVNTGTITGALTYDSAAGTNNSALNTTVNTEQLKDDTSYTFTMTMFNESSNADGILGTCERIFIPDNTVPVVSLSTPTDKSKDVDGLITFTYTCTNSSSANLYAEDSGGYTQYAMSESSDTCTYSNLKLLTNGFHSHYIVGSDGLNTTTSATSTVEVRRPGGPGTAEVTTTTGGGALAGKGGIIAVGILFWMFFLRKKGKGK